MSARAYEIAKRVQAPIERDNQPDLAWLCVSEGPPRYTQRVFGLAFGENDDRMSSTAHVMDDASLSRFIEYLALPYTSPRRRTEAWSFDSGTSSPKITMLMADMVRALSGLNVLRIGLWPPPPGPGELR